MDKTTAEERSWHSQRTLEGKAAKRAERGVIVFDEPRLPDTRISQITNARPPSAATASRLPRFPEVFGAPIANLAHERVNQAPDAASLSYDEREHRENIERRKLRIEYYDRTGQFDKATLWDAQLGKSLERHQRDSAPIVRKKLEAEYSKLSSQLDELYEAEAAAMTDEELDFDVAGHEDDYVPEAAWTSAKCLWRS